MLLVFAYLKLKKKKTSLCTGKDRFGDYLLTQLAKEFWDKTKTIVH